VPEPRAQPGRAPQAGAAGGAGARGTGGVQETDTGTMRATLKQAYTHPAGLAAANQGSMQVLADGRVLVGWGNKI
jgi:hypothetical protein